VTAPGIPIVLAAPVLAVVAALVLGVVAAALGRRAGEPALARRLRIEQRHRFGEVAGADFGVGNVWLPMTMAAKRQRRRRAPGLASGLVNTSQQIGGALGLAVLSTIANGHTGSPDATVDGFTLAFATGVGFLLVALLVLWSRLRREDVDVSAAVPAPIR
jgi:hypothetical protein